MCDGINIPSKMGHCLFIYLLQAANQRCHYGGDALLDCNGDELVWTGWCVLQLTAATDFASGSHDANAAVANKGDRICCNL